MKKHAFLILFAVILIYSTTPTVNADNAGQTGTLAILPGSEIALIRVPDSVTFPPSFIPAESTEITLDKVLDPSRITDTLEVIDLDPTRGFYVTLSLSDLTNASNNDVVINKTKLAIVSISADTSAVVDIGQHNNPDNADNITAPLYCPWKLSDNITFQNGCNSSLNSFTESEPPLTTLASNLNKNDTNIQLVDSNSLSSSGRILIENDIINYTIVTGNSLYGISNISSSHSNGTEVRQYYTDSQQVTLMENNSNTDVGTYSTGFGFTLDYNNSNIPESYGGTITFTLITIS